MREKRQRYQFKDDQTFLADCGVAPGDKQVPAQAYRMLAEQADDDWCQKALLVEKLSEQRQEIIALRDAVESMTRQNVALRGSNAHWEGLWWLLMAVASFVAGFTGALIAKGSL